MSAEGLYCEIECDLLGYLIVYLKCAMQAPDVVDGCEVQGGWIWCISGQTEVLATAVVLWCSYGMFVSVDCRWFHDFLTHCTLYS